MPIDLQEFHQELFQEIHRASDAEGKYVEDSFFDILCNYLVDAGEFDSADRAQYLSQRGMRVDGYGGDPASSEGVLNLIIADFSQSPDVATLTATDMGAIFNRLMNFLTRSLDARFRNNLEETSPAFGLADMIATRWPHIVKARLFLLSNRMLSTRVDGRPEGELQGVPISYSVWDLGRLHRYATSGREREDIEIDLENEFGGPLLLLPAHLDEAGYEAYLTVIPGKQLAAIYDRWGARLLEQNVRVFLQARGNVNRGIRVTLENYPDMFFAYNNGITTIADSVETSIRDGGLVLTRMRNFQIVNGGQTTASIHAASRNKGVDLSKVFVQMKLSIIDPSRAMDVVPKISQYANSQNRVTAADFFANHPFHVRMEQFSRRIFAPSQDGTFRESKWFYERARGQYLDARGRLTAAQRRSFDLEYPKRQMFSKTDLAKFQNVWRGQPHVVSKGAERNFAEFARFVSEAWSKRPDNFNEAYYREAVAKAIVFNEVEKLVTEQPWYQGGYRANVVAYAIAKLAHDVETRGSAVDFARIWRAQSISPGLREAFTIVAKAVHGVLIDPPSTTQNVTEWAKQQACWYRASQLNIEWPNSFLSELISYDEKNEDKRTAVKDQRMLNDIEAQTAVVKAGGAFWLRVREWGGSRALLTQTEREILDVATAIPTKLPSGKQSLIILKVLEKLHSEGCQFELDGT
ncbi:MAG: AIPR family protein [Chloroflexi bacterium]|nr:AIPR family protein [Chloroflexota bacterium]